MKFALQISPLLNLNIYNFGRIVRRIKTTILKFLRPFHIRAIGDRIKARALDDGKYVAMASLDLSAAFDVVNVPLLIKRMKILGLPDDVTCLVEIWLNERYFYVEVDGISSRLVLTWFGIIQGSYWSQ